VRTVAALACLSKVAQRVPLRKLVDPMSLGQVKAQPVPPQALFVVGSSAAQRQQWRKRSWNRQSARLWTFS